MVVFSATVRANGINKRTKFYKVILKTVDFLQESE